MAGISTVLTFLGFQKGVDWMEKRYNIIYADPPWKYDRQKGEGVAADIYQTMSLAEIESIPVNEIAADDAVLFLWVTLRKVFRLLKAGDLSIRPVLLTG